MAKYTQEQKDSMLLMGAKMADPATVKTAIAIGAHINAQDDDGNTALIYATMGTSEKSKDIYAALIKEKADVNLADDKGTTPLMWAVGRGNTDMCEKLIKDGADVDTQNRLGATPLYMAAKGGYTSMCLQLIAAGAYIEQEVMGKTPLMAAADADKRSCAIALMHAGAHIHKSAVLEEWLREMRDHVSDVFPAGALPNMNKCFSRGELSHVVLNACVTGQFDPLIGGFLLEAKEYPLFLKIWDALPEYWKDQNQGLYIEYMKQAKELGLPLTYSPQEGRAM